MYFSNFRGLFRKLPNICWKVMALTIFAKTTIIDVWQDSQKQPPEVLCKEAVLRNFAKFTEKHLCQRLFFNKVAGQRPKAYDFIKKEFLAQVFSREFCEISKNTLSYRALLLDSLDATELQQESFIFFT